MQDTQTGNDRNDRCWFCGNGNCDAFDSEFDTDLHKSCLKEALEKEPDHPEAIHMKYLLEGDGE